MESLQDLLTDWDVPTKVLRDLPRDDFTYPGLPLSYTSWQLEQLAWRRTAGFFDVSHHKVDLFVEGRDALRAFQDFGAVRFDGFDPGRAMTFVAVTESGHVIGDATLFRLDADRLHLAGGTDVPYWMLYQLQIGAYDCRWRLDDTSRVQSEHENFRYRIQGPATVAVLSALELEHALAARAGDLVGVEIAGRPVQLVRYSRHASEGIELFGAWGDRDEVRRALFSAGAAFGLTPIGAQAYFSSNVERGWIPSIAPGYLAGEENRGFREWMPAGTPMTLGGSFHSEDIRDYFVTPFDLGYGGLIDAEREYLGSAALRAHARRASLQPVSLIWDGLDVARARAKSFETGGLPAKEMDLAKTRYAYIHYDKVLAGGRMAGFSVDAAYVAPDRRLVSLAMVDPEFARPGSELTLVWGEEPGWQSKRSEAHEPVRIRVTVGG